MRAKQAIPVGAVLLTAMVVLGACTSGASNSGSKAASGGGFALGAPTSGPSAATNGAASDGSAGGASPGAKALDAAALGSAAKIRTASLTVAVARADAVATQADRAATLAVQVGGEVDADNRSGGTDASAILVLRVPPAALEPTLTALSRLGTEKSRQLSTTDVTEQVADVASRVASASAAIIRLRGLYAQATKVSDVIAVESELSSREADLESLQSQQRALARQTALASITLNLITAAAAPARHSSGGFLGGLRRGWHGFVAAAGWLATAVGTTLPFLLIVALLGFGAWLLRARPGLRRRRPPADPALHP